MTVREALQRGSVRLLHGSVRTLHPRLDAETLLLHAMRKDGDRAFLLTHKEDELDPETFNLFESFIAHRALGKPVQYITGWQEFWGIPFEVSPAVLIPRPETEHVIEAALRIVSEAGLNRPRIVDVGTGSGCIAIALAHSLPDAAVTAIDISGDALAVARRNANRLEAQVEFLEGDLLLPVQGRQFDLVVSNPPYIGTDQAGDVESQVKAFEPSVALWAGAQGMEVYRRLVPTAWEALVPGGHLVLELGWGMADKVERLLTQEHWGEREIVPDLQGIPRVVTAAKPL